MKTIKAAKKRNVSISKELSAAVAAIIDDVRSNGDEALLRLSRKFDGCGRSLFRVSQQEIDEAYGQLSRKDLDDIKEAAENIRSFACAQKETIKELPAFSPRPGITLGHRVIPVRSCCCYVPGGSYPLYSTALMLAIPAKAAGVPRVAACSPVIKGTEKISPKTLAAMDIAGVDEIYAIGGAQAIAAFAYGTEQISPVDMIVGPGNSYVAEAKRQCFGQVGIDFPAGPSEVLIIADDTVDAKITAADILAQSEHDRVARGILITTSERFANDVTAEVEAQLASLPTAEIARSSWNDYGEVLLAESLDEAAAAADDIAPEHLELQTAENERLAAKLCNYGSLFIGKNTAEVFGDYASGTNHTLPTMRAARFTGGVWVGTFLKTCTHQYLTDSAVKELAPLVARLARGEGLEGHARASEARLKNK